MSCRCRYQGCQDFLNPYLPVFGRGTAAYCAQPRSFLFQVLGVALQAVEHGADLLLVGLGRRWLLAGVVLLVLLVLLVLGVLLVLVVFLVVLFVLAVVVLLLVLLVVF